MMPNKRSAFWSVFFLCVGVFMTPAREGMAQIASASLTVKPVPKIDTLTYDCPTGSVKIRASNGIALSTATYYVVSTTPSIVLPPNNNTGNFSLGGAKSAVMGVDMSGCYTDTSIAFDCGGTALPATLLVFEVSLYETNKGLIEWQAEGAEELEKYELQESPEGRGYTHLAEIPVLQGASAEKTAYKYVDENLQRGFNFYRLALYHRNGQVTYAPVRTLFYDPRVEIKVAFYPNPTAGRITAEVNAEKDDDFLLYVYDGAGRVAMAPDAYKVVKGKNLVEIDISPLADGQYLFVYRLRDHQFGGSMRVIKKF